MDNSTALQHERYRDIQFFFRNIQAFASMSQEVMERTGKKPVLVCLRSGNRVTILGHGLDEKHLPANFAPHDLAPKLQRMLTDLEPGECVTMVLREENKTASLYRIRVALLH